MIALTVLCSRSTHKMRNIPLAEATKVVKESAVAKQHPTASSETAWVNSEHAG